MTESSDAALSAKEARRRVFQRLTAAGSDNAFQEAKWLVEQVVGSDDDDLTAAALQTLDRHVARRLSGEPLWRVLGEREFWGLTFQLSPATLEPRPDSETLVEAALEHLGSRRNGPLAILDLGTGTGCLLIALLSECPGATGLGIDLADQAVETARRNATANGVADRVEFRQGSWTAGLDRRFDLVVSNPPYIPTADIATLDAAVRQYDPRLALDGGGDGLGPYRIFAQTLSSVLAPDGSVVLEIGASQEDDVKTIMHAGGFVWQGSRRDLGGHPRALIFAFP